MTRAVNVRHELCDVYVGRASSEQALARELARHGKDPAMVRGPLPLGDLGNPTPVGGQCQRCGARHGRSPAALRCYTFYLFGRVLAEPAFSSALQDLRGARLGCWCLDEQGRGMCHATVLAAAIDEDLLHDVKERAVALEYDAGLSRTEADEAAVEWAVERLQELWAQDQTEMFMERR